MRASRFSGMFLSHAKADGEPPASAPSAGAASQENTSVPWLSSSGVQRILHYEIETKLGQGGMGIVYKALDKKLNRVVALKFLPSQLDRSNADLQRFLQEAQALSALNHPHIATIYAVEDYGGQQFLVLEYLPGGTLKAKLHQAYASGGSLAIDDIFKYARQTAEGLLHAHSRGIVHRDVKTSNLMLTSEGAVKITDFGVAKLGGSSLATLPGSLMGTIAYMSPEQALGHDVDARSDVFSFGVCLFEVTTGRLPFEAPNDAALITKVASARAPDLEDFRADVPATLEQVVQRALKKRVEDRYQTMDDVLQDLQAPAPASRPLTQTRPRVSVRAPVERAPKPRLRGVTLAALLFAAAIAGALYLREVFKRPELPAYKLLAVLPFRNMTKDESLQALCDGLSEVIPNKLSQLEQFQDSLQVMAASEIVDHKVTSVQAARALGATLALEGTLVRIRDRLTVSLVLRETAKQNIVVARDIEVPSENSPELQTFVEKIVELLNVPLKPEARAVLAAGFPNDIRAYDFYLEGRGYLQRYDLVENLDKAIAIFQQAVARDPSYALAYAGLAEAYLRKYQRTREVELVDLARDSGQRASQLNPGLAAVHYAMGMIHATRGDYERAIESFRNSIKIQQNSDAYRELAKAYDALGRIDEAESTHQAAIQMRPTYWAGYRELAVFYQKHGKFNEALPYFQKVLELTPDNYVGLANLGGLYFKLRQPSKAIEYLRRSISIKPTWHAHFNLGTVAYDQKRYTDAIEYYKKAIELTPTEARGWAALADAYRFVPQPPDRLRETYAHAIELNEKELTVNPRDGNARARIASWRVFTDKTQALKEIGEALQLSPHDGSVQSLAALVYDQCDMREEALAALKSALEFGASMEEIQHWPPLEQLMQDPRWTSFIEKKPAESLPVPRGRNH